MDNQSANSKIEKFTQLSKSEKNIKQKNQYDAVLFYLEGRSHHEISEVLHIPHRTVSEYIFLYMKGGAEALFIRKQPDRQDNRIK